MTSMPLTLRTMSFEFIASFSVPIDRPACKPVDWRLLRAAPGKYRPWLQRHPVPSPADAVELALPDHRRRPLQGGRVKRHEVRETTGVYLALAIRRSTP